MKSIVIGVAGGSGSGKSTFTNRIKKYFGDDVVVLYHDNYYRSQDGIPFEQRVTVNYDHPDALETDLMVEHLKKLKAGESIECPVYDFTKHTRSSQVWDRSQTCDPGRGNPFAGRSKSERASGH